MTQNWTKTINTRMKITKMIKNIKKNIIGGYVYVEKIW